MEISWTTLKFPLSLEVVKSQITKNDDAFPNDSDINQCQIPIIKDVKNLENDMFFDLGNRLIKVIHTPA